MKKLFTLMLAFIMIFAFVACDNSDDDDDDDEGSGSKITIDQLQQNAEDMGYVAANDPTDASELAYVKAEMISGLEDLQSELEGATDDMIIAEFGEDLLDDVKALMSAELKGGLTYCGEFYGGNMQHLYIYGFENAADAKTMEAYLAIGDLGNDTVIVKDKYLIIGWSEEVANAVINGAEKVESVNGMNAEELYQNEYDRVSNATSITTVTTQDIVIRLSDLGAGYDETASQEMTVILSGDDQYGYSTGVNGNQEYWYIDGIYYCIADGQKIKGELDLDAYAQKLGLQDAKQGLINVPADWFKGVELKTVDGTYFMVMTVKGEKYTELVGNALGDAYEAQGIKVEVSDVAYRVYLDENGSIDYMVADYQLYLTISGQTVTADIYQRTEISDINSSVIDPIDDPDSFTEVDLESVLGMN